MTTVVQIEGATSEQQCRSLRMRVIAAQRVQVAEQAIREKRSHLSFLPAGFAV